MLATLYSGKNKLAHEEPCFAVKNRIRIQKER